MKITTAKFGDIQFDESAVLEIQDGILGFPDFKRYVLINAEENSPFKWLQSLDEMGLAFLVIDPFVFKSDYKVDVSDKVKKEIGAASKDDYIFLVIVVVRADPKESTANLLGPIIVNIHSKKAKQLVLSNTDYPTQYKLLGSKKCKKK